MSLPLPRAPRREGIVSVRGRDVPAAGVPLVRVNPPLPLLQIQRIARQVPVDQAVAPGMEIEPLLSYRRAREHEGPERAVNGLLNAVRTASWLMCSPSSVRTWPKRRANTVRTRIPSRSTVAPDAPDSARKNSAWTRARAGCTTWTSFPRALGGGFVRAGVLGPRALIPEQVPLFVEHRLQIALPAVVQHEPSPPAAVPAASWRSGYLSPAQRENRHAPRPSQLRPDGVHLRGRTPGGLEKRYRMQPGRRPAEPRQEPQRFDNGSKSAQ